MIAINKIIANLNSSSYLLRKNIILNTVYWCQSEKYFEHCFFQVSAIGVAAVLLCAPIFAIAGPKTVGASLLQPYGVLCTFNSAVPIWGRVGVALPILNYFAPACASALLTAWLCAHLLRHARLMRKRQWRHRRPREEAVNLRDCNALSGRFPNGDDTEIKWKNRITEYEADSITSSGNIISVNQISVFSFVSSIILLFLTLLPIISL